MTGLTRAVDTDFGGGGPPRERAWFDRLRDLGYGGFITTAHTFWGGVPRRNGHAAAALERALEAGLWVGCYSRPVHLWERGVRALPAEIRAELRFFVLDVEPEPGGPYPLRREYVDGVRSLGLRPAVYTGRGMWGDVMGPGAPGFGDVALHEFAGDTAGWPASIGEEPRFSFGGWNRPGLPATVRSGWQVRMADPPSVDGTPVDDSVFTEEFVHGAEDAFVSASQAGGYARTVTVPTPDGAADGHRLLLHACANDRDRPAAPEGWSPLRREQVGDGVAVWLFERAAAGAPAAHRLSFDGKHWHFAAVTAWRGTGPVAAHTAASHWDAARVAAAPPPGAAAGVRVVAGFHWGETPKSLPGVRTVVHQPRGLAVGYRMPSPGGEAPPVRVAAGAPGHMAAVEAVLPIAR
ncbi:hypothetical protein J0910_14510 [Nocardiopsis sp. CNT-189]|uniref:hypothetical protein n=1 Tax=Nocardiopsis oceanisediminis TaxID=2816862 RepID=UPI003B34B929